MIMQQEQEVNAPGFDTISRSITPLIDTSINVVRSIMTDDRVTGYMRLQYPSQEALIHARINCRDYLRSEVTQHEGIYGVLLMRQDGSLFGTLPEGNFFLDDPQDNPLPGGINWKSVDALYGECYAMMLMDESVFEDLFATIQDGKSTWHVFTEDQTEIYHTGENACRDPERLISQSNSGTVFDNEDGIPVCTFSTIMTVPPWGLVREVSMVSYEQVIHRVRSAVCLIGAVVLLIALALYRLWLKKFMGQFNLLLKGIVRMGQGELKPIESAPFTIGEFEIMQQEINRTSLALNDQMDTIRRMEREQMEQENLLKEKCRRRFLRLFLYRRRSSVSCDRRCKRQGYTGCSVYDVRKEDYRGFCNNGTRCEHNPGKDQRAALRQQPGGNVCNCLAGHSGNVHRKADCRKCGTRVSRHPQKRRSFRAL